MNGLGRSEGGMDAWMVNVTRSPEIAVLGLVATLCALAVMASQDRRRRAIYLTLGALPALLLLAMVGVRLALATARAMTSATAGPRQELRALADAYFSAENDLRFALLLLAPAVLLLIASAWRLRRQWGKAALLGAVLVLSALVGLRYSGLYEVVMRRMFILELMGTDPKFQKFEVPLEPEDQPSGAAPRGTSPSPTPVHPE